MCECSLLKTAVCSFVVVRVSMLIALGRRMAFVCVSHLRDCVPLSLSLSLSTPCPHSTWYVIWIYKVFLINILLGACMWVCFHWLLSLFRLLSGPLITSHCDIPDNTDSSLLWLSPCMTDVISFSLCDRVLSLHSQCVKGHFSPKMKILSFNRPYCCSKSVRWQKEIRMFTIFSKQLK